MYFTTLKINVTENSGEKRRRLTWGFVLKRPARLRGWRLVTRRSALSCLALSRPKWDQLGAWG